jgi:acetylglutamate/LysW-gamma-L-alpha-aminoadipate kinase
LVIVVKVGGSILGEGVDNSILEDIQKITTKRKLVIVHGGGSKVTEIATKLGKQQRFIISPGGIKSRYTDLETAKIFTMVMTGIINKEIVRSLQETGLRAIGLSGIDGGLIRAERKKRLIIIENEKKIAIDGGYTGKISDINDNLLRILLREEYLPVISPIALGSEFEPLNIDGDRAAAYVAGGLKAETVIFLTDVSGLLINGKLMNNITKDKAEVLRPKIGHGMEKKVLASIEAVSMGVKESVISSGLVKNPISSALKHKECTVITE